MHFFVLNNNHEYTKYLFDMKIFFFVPESNKIIDKIKLFYFEII